MGDHARSASYVAIVPDGNARWAKKNGLSVLAGHKAGSDAIKEAVRSSVALGVRELTVWAFSTENWLRPKTEVAGLMRLFTRRIKQETPELDAEGVRMRFIGRRDRLDKRLVEQIESAEAQTASNDRLSFFVGFDYGGRAEIVDAARAFTGTTEEEFRQHLYAPEMHDPDLVIRTSGEQRLSNYLLWQTAYSEFHFTDALWPDFGRAEYEAALADYATRERRFGAR